MKKDDKLEILSIGTDLLTEQRGRNRMLSWQNSNVELVGEKVSFRLSGSCSGIFERQLLIRVLKTGVQVFGGSSELKFLTVTDVKVTFGAFNKSGVGESKSAASMLLRPRISCWAKFSMTNTFSFVVTSDLELWNQWEDWDYSLDRWQWKPSLVL